MVLVLYPLYLMPLLRRTDVMMKRTRAMLLLLPADVTNHVEAVNKAMREYVRGRQIGRSSS